MIEVRITKFQYWWEFTIFLHGKVIATSDCYTRRHSAMRGAKRLIKAIQSGRVVYK